MTDRNDILEMAQGHLGRVLAIRLRPGTDVLKGLEELVTAVVSTAA